jgi:hypothetical protein
MVCHDNLRTPQFHPIVIHRYLAHLGCWMLLFWHFQLEVILIPLIKSRMLKWLFRRTIRLLRACFPRLEKSRSCFLQFLHAFRITYRRKFPSDIVHVVPSSPFIIIHPTSILNHGMSRMNPSKSKTPSHSVLSDSNPISLASIFSQPALLLNLIYNPLPSTFLYSCLLCLLINNILNIYYFKNWFSGSNGKKSFNLTF